MIWYFFLLFSILGINVFAYLAKGTDVLSKLTQKGGEKAAKGVVEETKEIAKKGKKAVEKAIETKEKNTRQKNNTKT